MDKRWRRFCELMDEFIDITHLAQEYDSMPRMYGDRLLYQVECHTVQLIGKVKGITITDIAAKMKKTVSASSQVIRKLKAKGLVNAFRNPDNQREMLLELTESGWEVFNVHEKYDEESYRNFMSHFTAFSDDELAFFRDMLRRLKHPLTDDVERTKAELTEISGKPPKPI